MSVSKYLDISKNYISHISYADVSPIPVRSAVKLYLTSWFAQNLSKRALNKLTVLTSTTWFFSEIMFVKKIFQFTESGNISAVKLHGDAGSTLGDALRTALGIVKGRSMAIDDDYYSDVRLVTTWTNLQWRQITGRPPAIHTTISRPTDTHTTRRTGREGLETEANNQRCFVVNRAVITTGLSVQLTYLRGGKAVQGCFGCYKTPRIHVGPS